MLFIPENVTGSKRRVTAQLHLGARGEPAQRPAAPRIGRPDEGRLGQVELRGDVLHPRRVPRLIEQDHTSWVPAERVAGKGVNEVTPEHSADPKPGLCWPRGKSV